MIGTNAPHWDEPDVVIVGAGASGAAVAWTLAEAGFRVVCLEQGDWHDKADYPGIRLDWELQQRKAWATSPNIRQLPEDLSELLPSEHARELPDVTPRAVGQTRTDTSDNAGFLLSSNPARAESEDLGIVSYFTG